MGIDIDVAKFLYAARTHEADFQKTLMLGNQQFQFLNHDYQTFADTFGIKKPDKFKDSREFLQFLGAQEISAMDVSDYEGAAIIHDLNQPIADAWREKFSVVIDGGTLEHIFNFPVALANAMQMVAVGGHLIIIAGGNNFLGHGFYQFSPELFYRTLNAANGFRVERLIAAEVRGGWYEVADPQNIKSRVELINDKPIYMLVLAQKIESKTPFETAPQQSDYVEMWTRGDAPQKDDAPKALKSLLKKNDFVREAIISLKIKQAAQRKRRESSFANDRAFRLVDK